MGSPSKSSRLRRLNQVHPTSNTSMEVKGKLKPNKEVIPMGTPFRSIRLRQSTQAQATSIASLDHVLFKLKPTKEIIPTSTRSKSNDSKDEGINNENENMDGDSSNYNELLGTTMEAPRKKETTKKVHVQDASGLKGHKAKNLMEFPHVARGLKGLRKKV